MGVDYYACQFCGDPFPDCDDHVRCDCGNRWCSYSCAESDGYEADEEKSCNFCRNEDFEDHELLELAIGLLGISRCNLVEMKKDSLEVQNV